MSNKLAKLTSLKNQYFLMRHGQSTANQQGLIVSAPENGIPKYGLTDKGRAQVDESIKKTNALDSDTHIISSDFKRARESAEIVGKLLKSKTPVLLDVKLRERNFGDFELSDNTHYQAVWDNDAVNSAHTIDDVESADSVMERATALVVSMEKKYSGETFLLVAHGDTLQILQAAFKRQAASIHRELPHLGTAEIRALDLS